MANSQQPREWSNFRSDPHLGDLEILHAHYIEHRFSPHFHDEYAIGIIEHGAERLAFGRSNTLTIGAGSIVLLNPGEIHAGHALSGDGWMYRMLYPSVSLVRGVFEEMCARRMDMPYFSRATVRDNLMFQRIRSTHKALLDESVSSLEKQSRLISMLGLLVCRYGHQKPDLEAKTQDRSNIWRAAEYIDTSFGAVISLDKISNIAGLSRFHFCRAFKKVVGISPHSYQLHRRIQRSKILIRAGTPLADVAVETGFFDQSHLSRHFKRIVGVSPGAYAP